MLAIYTYIITSNIGFITRVDECMYLKASLESLCGTHCDDLLSASPLALWSLLIKRALIYL